MKLSYNWMKKYINLKVKPEELAEGLTMSGSEIEATEQVGKDTVFDLEITSNRPDCLSIIGLAREAAAVFNKKLTVPKIKPCKRGDKTPLKIKIENKNLCSFYTARIIKDLNVKDAGKDIAEALTSMGLRLVNNVVDVTNYCLLEAGQPLHAFDLDKIKGNCIIIREAKKGEKLVTIDNIERELTQGMLIIADEKGPIAIAGVMGGKETEVTEATKNILLESAYFDFMSVRSTARRLALSSDSSYRFERGVDKGNIVRSSDRAVELITKEAGGEVSSFYSEGGIRIIGTQLYLDVARCNDILGVTIPGKEVQTILQNLGMKIVSSGNIVKVTVPSFREDLKSEIDLIEEVARIYGYHKIPTEINKFIPQVIRKEKTRQVEEKIREELRSLGLNEIMTYSLINEKAVTRFGELSEDMAVLDNAISEEHKILTPQLIDGMLKSIAWNINRKNTDLGFYEAGKVYGKAEKRGYIETPTISIGLTGLLRENWKEGARVVNFYDLKGMIEELLQRVQLEATFSDTEQKGFINCAQVTLSDDIPIGFMGSVKKKVLDEYDIAQEVYICQLDLGVLMEKGNLANKYQSIPKFPFSSRDISILCDKGLASDKISITITEAGGEIIKGVELVDVYEGKQIEQNKKSFTYSIQYGSDEKTLLDEEIENIHTKIKDVLSQKFNVTFR